MATQAQIEANRKNAEKSTGPRTVAGKESSRANSIKDGLTGQGVVLLAEQRRKVDALAASLTETYGGKDITLYDAKLVERVALESVRSCQCQEMEDAIYLDESHDAEFNWDDAQDAAASALADGLARRPSTVSRQLEATSHGCAWKVERWEWLLLALDKYDAPWDADRRAVAFDLIGIPRAFRDVAADLNAEGDRETVAKQRALALAELERIHRKKALWLDARSEFHRELKIKGVAFPGKEVWRLRRLAMGATARFFSGMNELMKRHEGKSQVAASTAAPKAIGTEEEAAAELKRERVQHETSRRVREAEAAIKALINAPAPAPAPVPAKPSPPAENPAPALKPQPERKDARDERRERRAANKRQRQARKR